jgi:hypothetical protein
MVKKMSVLRRGVAAAALAAAITGLSTVPAEAAVNNRAESGKVTISDNNTEPPTEAPGNPPPPPGRGTK